MTQQQIKESLINAGVKNLKQFGYTMVDKENIFTDVIYKAFFLKMLEDYIGKANAEVDKVIDELMTKITDRIK